MALGPAMQLDFRLFLAEALRSAPAGELHLQARAPADADRIDLAHLALEKGMDGFVHGEGEIERLVVKIEPTLDEMLAALILTEVLAGRRLDKAAEFADYTHAVRKGVRPAPDIPLEDSLEAIFLTIRNDAGKKLTDSETSERFRRSWRKMADVIVMAVRKGVDPHQTNLFEGKSAFNTERQFLRSDHKVYRRDVSNGERWMIQLPGQCERDPALYLSEPKSSGFKFWARGDAEAPGGTGYHFLAVSWGDGQWIFSTDPCDRLVIKSLTEPLQAAERARDPEHAARDPWYNGARHGYTVVGAPKSGSKLTDAEVLGVVRAWGSAEAIPHVPEIPGPKPNGPARRQRRWLVSAAVVALAAVAFLVWWRWPQRALDAFTPSGALANLNGAELLTPKGPPVKEGESEQKVSYKLRNSQPQTLPTKLWVQFGLATEKPFETIGIQLHREPRREVPLIAIQHGKGPMLWGSEPIRTDVPPGEHEISVFLPTTGEVPHCELIKQDVSHGVIHLYGLAVGVNHPAGFNKLDYAKDDAEAVTAAFRAQRGWLFDQVRWRDPLVNEKASAGAILKALKDLADEVGTDQKHLKLVVVYFSGHGMIEAGGSFVFVPHDFNENEPVTWLTWQQTEMLLKRMRCPVLLVLDSCHSGQAAHQLARSKDAARDEDVQKAIDDIAGQTPGLMLLAAAKADQKAWESKGVGHGLLTNAILEGIGDKARSKGPVVSLRDLTDYVREQVWELSKKEYGTKKQDIVPFHPVGIEPSQIPIAWRGLRRP